jgi:hypothetical protein
MLIKLNFFDELDECDIMIMLIFISIIWMNEYPFGIDDDFSVINLQIKIKINSFLSLGSGGSFEYYMIYSSFLRNNPQDHKKSQTAITHNNG